MCNWHGITCSSGHVIEVELAQNNLQEELPSEIGQLTNLEQLDLSGNQFLDLPSGIGQIANRKELWLNHNQLVALPPELGQLTKRQILHLSNNQLIELPPVISQNGKLLIDERNRLCSQ